MLLTNNDVYSRRIELLTLYSTHHLLEENMSDRKNVFDQSYPIHSFITFDNSSNIWL